MSIQTTDDATAMKIRNYSGNADLVTIERASGNVGIGKAVPAYILDIEGASPRMWMKDTTSSGSHFEIGVDTSAVGLGNRANLPLNLFTNNTTRMTIDSSGNVLVGKTGTAFGTAGIEARSGGTLWATASGTNAASFNRLSSDGAIAYFSKDGTTVGSIGTEGGDLAIGNGDVGLQFINGGQTVRGFNMTTNARIDAQVDLGMASTRFKDLYLSGGVVFGTTGGSVSSKTLDDYEEGTWSPTLTASSSGSLTLNSSYDLLGYTKIGRVVTITGQLVISSINSPAGVLTLGNLPFEMLNGSKAASQTRPSIHLYGNGTGSPSAGYYPAFIAFNEGSRFGAIVITYNSTFQSSAADWMGNGSDIFVNFSYHTT
jgi:hypothetical protein